MGVAGEVPLQGGAEPGGQLATWHVHDGWQALYVAAQCDAEDLAGDQAHAGRHRGPVGGHCGGGGDQDVGGQDVEQAVAGHLVGRSGMQDLLVRPDGHLAYLG